MNAIEIRDLSKKFKGIPAVDHLDMTVPEGSVYGFIGENGSGKSTTEKLICGLLVPSGGKIKLFGKPYTDPKTRSSIGVLIEDPACFPNSTVYQNLYMQALNIGVNHPDEEVTRVLRLVKMEDAAGKKFKECSLGMKQRLGIAQSLMGHPRLLILDEPINGLDADGVKIVRETLQEVNREEGVTILISSHILDELSKIATHYGILKEGKLIQEIKAEQMSERCRDYVLVKTVNDLSAFGYLRTRYKSVASSDEGIRIYGEQNSARAAAILHDAGIPVTHVELRRIGLEQYYIDVMQEANKNE